MNFNKGQKVVARLEKLGAFVMGYLATVDADAQRAHISTRFGEFDTTFKQLEDWAKEAESVSRLVVDRDVVNASVVEHEKIHREVAAMKSEGFLPCFLVCEDYPTEPELFNSLEQVEQSITEMVKYMEDGEEKNIRVFQELDVEVKSLRSIQINWKKQ